MYIKTLHIKNWRSHSATSFTFGKFNLLRGPNNSGKSSVAQAIEYVLTGRCAGLTENGAGADKYLTLGRKGGGAEIEAHIAVNKGLQYTLKRTRTPSTGSLTLSNGSGQPIAGRQAEEFLGELGLEKDAVSAALRAGRFLALSKDAQKELLADVLKPADANVPEEIREALGLYFTVGGAANAPATMGLETVRALEKSSITTRAECTAALRELGEPEAVPERPADQPTASQCMKRLDGLRMEQNSLVREKQVLQNSWADRVRQGREALAKLPQARERVLDNAEEAACLKIIENEPKIIANQELLDRLRFEIAGLEQDIKTASKKAGKCPTCGHAVETEDLITRYQGGISARKSRIPTLEGMLPGEPLHKIKETLRAHREAVIEVERLKKLLSELPADEPAPDTTEHDRKIAELEERMKKGQEVVADIVRQESARALYLKVIENRQRLESKREAADKVAKWAGPSGVQATMSGENLPAFVKTMDQTLARFGYSVAIFMEPYSIEILRIKDGHVTSIDPYLLSESEQYRFSVAFQVALAKVTGIGFVVLDRADVLVGDNRGTLIEALLKSGLDQVFVLASAADRVPVFPEIKVFDLSLDEQGLTQIEKG